MKNSCLTALVLALATLGSGLAPARAGINEWTPLGPFGGIVTALAVDPRNPGTLYAATTAMGVTGRLYKTTDGGTNWTLLNSALGGTSIVIDPQNPRTIYVGLRNYRTSVFKSTDGGASFGGANAGLEGRDLQALAVDPMNAGTLYAVVSVAYLCVLYDEYCSAIEVLKTTDGGASWNAAGAGLPQGEDSFGAQLAVDPQDSRILYLALHGLLGGTHGLFKSTNAGVSWTAINSSVNVWGLVIDPLNHDTLYAASPGGVVRLSSDGTILSTTPVGGGNITSLGIDQNSGTLYAAVGSRIFKSTDGGTVWVATALLPAAARDFQQYGDAYSLAVDQTSGAVYAIGYGVLKTTDGGANWTEANYGLGNFEVRSVTVAQHNPGTLYALSASPPGVVKTVDGGRTWAAVRHLEEAASLTTDPRDSNILYAVTKNFILKSADGGATWNETAREIWASSNGRYTFPGPLVIDPQNPGTLYVLAHSSSALGRTDIFKSTDGAAVSWFKTGSLSGNVTSLSIDPRNSSTLYAGSRFQPILSKSTDAGVTWIESTLPLVASPTSPIDNANSWVFVTSVTIDPQNSSVVYATGSAGVFKSTNGGQSWIPIGGRYLVDSMVIDPQKSILYVVSRGGILRSKDGGSNWTQVNAGLSAPFGVNSLALDPGNPSTLYAAAGGGVYTITFANELQ